MHVSADPRLLALNPDDKSLAAGERLGTAQHWQSGGSSTGALWGECRGSAVYQVAIDLETSGYRCSCPSRKFPCKHVVGLMMLHLREPDSLPRAECPEWVTAWLEKRITTARRPAAASSKRSPVPTQKRADERLRRVLDGIAGLELWLADIERDGLARVQTQPHAFWERQAARLVDAQAPGLASRVRALGAIPASLPDWPDRVLAGLGQLVLLIHAFHHLDALDSPLQHDIRRLVGWSLSADEVTQLGEPVRDQWILAGQIEEKDDRLITQRTWLQGRTTGRTALVLQFIPKAGGSFPHIGRLGTIQDMELRFWPSVLPQRARIEERFGSAQPCTTIRGFGCVEEFLRSTAEAVGRLPWHDRSLCILEDAVLVRRVAGRWQVRDKRGIGLPLVDGEHWHLLAITGARPCTFIGEWTGERLRPTGWMPGELRHDR
jgi:hypothetical protein